MMRVRRHVLVGVLGVALSSTSAIAHAQSTTAQVDPKQKPADVPSSSTTGTDIVVTGIRASLAEGIDIKRNSSQIMDSVVAEDIGKLPDQNVAESLSRVSGVQVEQGIDEAKDISIRGLRQNRLEFNGRTLISPYGRGPDGPDEGSYNVLTLIPSELVSRLDVTKLPAASQVEGSLGGTVNILTRHPSRSDPFFIGGTLEGVYKDKADKFSGRATGLVSALLLHDTLGVSVGVNYQRLNIRTDSTDSFTGWRPFDTRFNNNAQKINYDPNGDGSPIYWYNDIRYQVLKEQRKKLGVTADLNWTPSSRFNAYADFLYAHANTRRDRNWLSVPLSPTGSSYTNIVVSDNEDLIAGTVKAVLQGNGEVIRLPTNIYSGAIGGTWNATDRLTLNGEFSYSNASQDYKQSYLRADTKKSVPVDFDFRGTDVPSISYPDTLDLTDPQNFVFRTSYDNLYLYRSKETAGRLDLTYALDGFFNSFKLGARYSDIHSSRGTYRNQTVYSTTQAPVVNYPDNYTVLDYPDLLKGATGSFPTSFVSAVPLGSSGFVCEAIVSTCTPQLYDPTSSYTLDEPITAGYAQADFGSTLFGADFTGNVGLRYVHSEVHADGTIGSRYDPSHLEPNHIVVRYDDWLPSAAFRVELAHNLLLRFGGARVMSRPDTADLTPSFSVVESSGSASVGNPALKPFRVNQADLSLEYYPRKGAIYSLALFYKDVESFLYQQQFNETIPGFTPDPTTSPDGTFRITRTMNGEGGEIKGLEAQATQPLWFMPRPLDGLGVSATFSYIESSSGITDPRTHGDLPIPGLSKENVNLVGFYEKGWFQARVAWNWRSKYLYGLGTGGSGVFFRAYSSLSASVHFDLNKHLQLYFEGSNLTNSPVRRFGGFEEATMTYTLNGPTYTGGIRARF